MGKQILIALDGGCPKGNTTQLVAAFTHGVEAAGHMVETVSLMKNEVKRCLGCNSCRYGKPCVQRDAFNSLLPKIKSADRIVLASQLCFGTLSVRIKKSTCTEIQPCAATNQFHQDLFPLES